MGKSRYWGGSATLHIDGGARPKNPGHAGFGVVLVHEDGETLECSRYIGIQTNNYAEYMALVVGVKMAIQQRVNRLDIYTDSQLIEGQMLFDHKCNVPALKLMRDEALKLLRTHFGEQLGWTLTWVKRDKNSDADALATAAINFGRNQNPFTPDNIKDKRQPAFVRDPFQ